jgi:hypothetical protein
MKTHLKEKHCLGGWETTVFSFFSFCIFFPNLCYTQSGNHLEEKLAKLGYRPHVNLKKKKKVLLCF